MKVNLLYLLILFSIISCGPSEKKRNEIITVACNLIAESKNIDATYRLQVVNEAREKLGEELYLGDDDLIKEAYKFGLCSQLVSNSPIFQKRIEEERINELNKLKEELEEIRKENEKREAKRKKEQEKAQQLARELQAESQAEEKRRDAEIDAAQEEWRSELEEYINKRGITEVIKISAGAEFRIVIGCIPLKGLKKQLRVSFKDKNYDDQVFNMFESCPVDRISVVATSGRIGYELLEKLRKSPNIYDEIESISINIIGVSKIEERRFSPNSEYKKLFPEFYKALKVTSKLKTPIVINLNLPNS